MQVQARHNRHLGTDHLAHTGEDLALAVVDMLADHGAMQVKVDAIERHRLLQPINEAADDGLEGLARDMRGRRCSGPRQRHDLVVGVSQHVDRPRNRQVGAVDRIEQHVAMLDGGPSTAFDEGIQTRASRREGIGLVLHAAYGDPHCLRRCHDLSLPVQKPVIVSAAPACIFGYPP